MQRFFFQVGFLGCGAVLLFSSAVHAAGTPSYDDAVAAFQKPDYELAAKRFEALLAESPSWAQGHVALAQCYYMLGEPGPAERSIGKATEYDPDTDLFRAYYSAGNRLYEQKRYDEAVEPLNKALEHAPQERKRSTSLRLAYAYFASHELDDAIRTLRRHHERFGVDFDSAYLLAMACSKEKQYGCAVDNVRKARELEQGDEKDPKLTEYLARWSHTLALLPESEEHRDELLAQAVTDTKSWYDAERGNPSALRYYTETLVAAGQGARAIRELLPVAQRDEGNCTARLTLARAFNSLADGAEAEGWAEKAKACDPGMADAQVELAVAEIHRLRSEHSDVDEIRRDQELTRQAIAALERARDLEPEGHPRTEALLADARTTLSRLEQAETELVASDREHQDAIRAEQLEETRLRCKGILWNIEHDPERLSPEDVAFHEEHDCKQYARRTASPTE